MSPIKRKIQRKIGTKKCFFCQGKIEPDYKQVEVLSRFISERGRILSGSRTGLCARHQRRLGREIKRARYLALLPFITQV